MLHMTPNSLNVATASREDLLIADARGQVKYTVLKTQRPRKDLLVLTQTKGHQD